MAIAQLPISALILIKALQHLRVIEFGVRFYLCKLQALEILPGLLETGVKSMQQVQLWLHSACSAWLFVYGHWVSASHRCKVGLELKLILLSFAVHTTSGSPEWKWPLSISDLLIL